MYENLFNMKGKTILAVGGAKGIAFESVRALIEYGAEVIIVGKTESNIDIAIADLAKEGKKAEKYVCDIGIKEDVEKMEEHFKDRRIDVLLLSAAVVDRTVFLETSDESFDRQFKINAYGPFWVGCFVARNMIRFGTKGKMIFFISTGAWKATVKYGAYSSSKAAAQMIMKTFALELAQYGITCNCLAPTATETELTRELYEKDPERKNNVIKNHPLGRIAKPSDYVGSILYLASDASNFATGSTLLVDGGKCAK